MIWAWPAIFLGLRAFQLQSCPPLGVPGAEIHRSWSRDSYETTVAIMGFEWEQPTNWCNWWFRFRNHPRYLLQLRDVKWESHGNMTMSLEYCGQNMIKYDKMGWGDWVQIGRQWDIIWYNMVCGRVSIKLTSSCWANGVKLNQRLAC